MMKYLNSHTSKGDNLSERLRPLARVGMRRLLFLVLVTTCAIIGALICTNGIAPFCSSDPFELLATYTGGYSKSVHSNPKQQKSTSCDYTVGRWVKTDIKPLYSGDTCKKYLAGMWACRLMPGRPDFEYENYRWHPEGCNLPAFDGQHFLRRMSNKVIAFIGDSIGRQQHQSLMCMLTGGNDDARVEDVGLSYGLIKPRGAIRPPGVAYKFTETNTTIIYYWSATLCDVQPLNATDPNTYNALHLDMPVMFLQEFVSVFDVVILNTGHHWNRGKMNANKWVQYVDGQPCTDPKYNDILYARNYSLSKITNWLDNHKKQNKTRAEIYLRSLSPRHFYGGEWNSGGRCDNNLVPVEQKNITGDGVGVDPLAENAVLGTSVQLLNITYISMFRDEAHISKYSPNLSGQDCLHWCLPGVPDVWNELLYAMLLFNNQQN